MALIKIFVVVVIGTYFVHFPESDALKCYTTDYNETAQEYNYAPELFDCDEEDGPNPGCVIWVKRKRLRYGCWRTFDFEDNFSQGNNWCYSEEACGCSEDGCNKLVGGSPNCKDCINWEHQGRYYGLKKDERYI